MLVAAIHTLGLTRTARGLSPLMSWACGSVYSTKKTISGAWRKGAGWQGKEEG